MKEGIEEKVLDRLLLEGQGKGKNQEKNNQPILITSVFRLIGYNLLDSINKLPICILKVPNHLEDIN